MTTGGRRKGRVVSPAKHAQECVQYPAQGLAQGLVFAMFLAVSAAPVVFDSPLLGLEFLAVSAIEVLAVVFNPPQMVLKLLAVSAEFGGVLLPLFFHGFLELLVAAAEFGGGVGGLGGCRRLRNGDGSAFAGCLAAGLLVEGGDGGEDNNGGGDGQKGGAEFGEDGGCHRFFCGCGARARLYHHSWF